MNKVTKGFFSAFLIICSTIGLLEISLRIFDPIGIEFFFETAKYRESLQQNEAYAYIHTPGHRETLQGVDVAINSHGLRGPEFAKEKPSGAKRVLILGDSAVFGWGAPGEHIFAREIQRLFSGSGRNVEVIPAGVCSWNTRTEYEYLRSEAMDFDPDAVLLVIVENDLVPKREGRTDVSKSLLFQEPDKPDGVKKIFRPLWRKSVGQSYLLKYIQYFVKIRSVLHSKKQVKSGSPKWEDARLALDGIIALCNERKIDLIVYLYAARSEVKRNPTLTLYNSYLQSKGKEVFLLPEHLFDPKYRISYVDGHPNAAGHMIIAQEMFKTLLPGLSRKQSDPYSAISFPFPRRLALLLHRTLHP